MDLATITANFFPLFGVTPAYGRNFLEAEESSGGPHVVMLSDRLWRRRYGADPGDRGPHDPGRRGRLRGRRHPAGRLSAGAAGGSVPGDRRGDVDAAPVRLRPRAAEKLHLLHGVRPAPPGRDVRAGPGRDERHCHAVPEGVSRACRDPGAHPGGAAAAGRGEARPARPARAARRRGPGAAHRLRQRGASPAGARHRAASTSSPFAPRSAPAAARWSASCSPRALCSRCSAALSASWSPRSALALLRALHPSNLPRLAEIDVDGRVLAFTALTCVATTLLFGLAPALQAAGKDPQRSLQGGGARAGTGAARHRVRALLILGEVALSVVLLVGAGLLVRSFVALQDVRPGFDARTSSPSSSRCRPAGIPTRRRPPHLRARARAPPERAARCQACGRHLQAPAHGQRTRCRPTPSTRRPRGTGSRSPPTGVRSRPTISQR